MVHLGRDCRIPILRPVVELLRPLINIGLRRGHLSDPLRLPNIARSPANGEPSLQQENPWFARADRMGGIRTASRHWKWEPKNRPSGVANACRRNRCPHMYGPGRDTQELVDTYMRNGTSYFRGLK